MPFRNTTLHQIAKLLGETEREVQRAQAVLHSLRTGLQSGQLSNEKAVALVQEAERHLDGVKE